MNDIEIKRYIHTVMDFPKPGIKFRDITPLLASPEVFTSVISQMAERVSDYSVDGIAGIEARGFIFGSAMATRLSLPFYLVRKSGKLPKQTARVEYELEYGSDALEIHLQDGVRDKNIAVVDDVLATGGTANAVASLLESSGNKVACMSFLMELIGLSGREKLDKYPVEPLLNFHLHE